MSWLTMRATRKYHHISSYHHIIIQFSYKTTLCKTFCTGIDPTQNVVEISLKIIITHHFLFPEVYRAFMIWLLLFFLSQDFNIMFEHVVILETSFLEKHYFPLLPVLISWLGFDFGMIVLAFSSSAFLISSCPFFTVKWKNVCVCFSLLPRCQNKFFIFTSCFCADSCLHCLLAVVRVFSGFLFRSPNWHPSLQDGYVRDKKIHINMQNPFWWELKV